MSTARKRDDACMEVLNAGPLSLVQDLGRDGWRHLGVGRGGALDPDCAALANALVGNHAGAAVLEFALQGPTLRLPQPLRIAVLGAACEARFDGQALPLARPVGLPAGTLALGGMREGARAWLAVYGGIDVPPVLGSRATDLRGGFGGVDGRALRKGDRLPIGAHTGIDVAAPQATAWWIDPRAGQLAQEPIRYIASEAAAMRSPAQELSRQPWQVHAASNRQGLRLDGAALQAPDAGGLSEPVAPGTIQLPSDGRPIVLLADAQTVGGYARLGHVIAADLPRLAQLRPNQHLRFRACNAAEAQAAAAAARAQRARLEWAIATRLGA
ncbi:biotin-dependent carboxyltransferase family protein [Lysobacter sp. 5GHs7-4]|uniref:5-oxoprolinase subunit C family protein n=1 Tax=Lysobacter sp. 5GHs7-4 TaxID=2904253 RepID=UPI001E2A89F1|nr:biotin-dependent carboxyltransferase family protein [Lysobacter sp. 5GHs7-4]UHQ21744.1 biotin-dependent carboxyltransferase family protein [Lysobacter sp. 5GHs7-4]